MAELKEILYRDECYAIQGAVYEVYREMGCGFLEAVYQECLEREFRRVGLPFKSQVELLLTYKGETLHQTYRPDFICYDAIILEIKAVKELTSIDRAQLINYLESLKTAPGTADQLRPLSQSRHRADHPLNPFLRRRRVIDPTFVASCSAHLHHPAARKTEQAERDHQIARAGPTQPLDQSPKQDRAD